MTVVQANRNGVSGADEDGTPELESIRDSDGIAHNATKVISIKQKADGVLEMGIKKNRFGKTGGRLQYLWDIDTGNFTFLSAEDKPKGRRQQKTENEPKNPQKRNTNDVF